MQIDQTWSPSWPQAGAAVPTPDQLAASDQFDHVGEFVAPEPDSQISHSTYLQGAIHRTGSKRLRPNDYAPSSSSLGGFMNSQTAAIDQRSAQTMPFGTHMFAHGMFEVMPSDEANGFSAPPSQHAPRLQEEYSSTPTWVASASDAHPRYPAELSGSHGERSTHQSGASYNLAQNRYAADHSTTDSQTYMPQQALDSNMHMPVIHNKFFYSMDTSYMTAHIQPNPHASTEDFDKSMEWPDAKWACTNFSRESNTLGMFQDAAGLYGKDASQHLKLQSLAILDNLATQIITALAKPSLGDLLKIGRHSNSDERQAYKTQKDLFDQTRKVYCRDSPFIDAFAVQLFTPSQQEVVRKANRATFVSSLLEAHDVDFFDLNDSFLEIFVPPGQRLLKWQGAIFLELKTQAYIYYLLNSEQTPALLVDELFPTNMEERILATHPDAPHLIPSEQDFVERVKARKQYLQSEPERTAMQSLPLKYAWVDFARELAACVHKNIEALLSTPNRSVSAAPSNTSGNNLNHTASSQPPIVTQASADPGHETRCQDIPRAYSSFGALVPEPNAVMQMADHRSRDSASVVAATNTPAAEKSPQPPRSEVPPKTIATTRQPWKSEEEDALLAGLEEVKGPYWSRILSLYGRGGSKSEVLKDRTQIQLKDKARNLKLWHLKMGNEVPACLQGVTGELRKRGGAKVRAQLGLDGEGEKTDSEKGSKKSQQ